MNLLQDDNSTKISNNPPMKRFASIDFLRGLAIFMMLILHQVADNLDYNTLLAGNNVNYISLIEILLLIVMPFLGGLAGLFLLASSIANMVSMQKNLKRGKSIRAIVFKQVTNGNILLLFAMLTEGLIGYHGAIGDFIHNLTDPFFDVSIAMTRWAHIETIHTIAWCIILNGIIQGLLSIKGGWKKPKRQMLIYAALVIIVIASTKFVWDGVYNGLTGNDGIGFPWGTNPEGSLMSLPDIRADGFVAVLVGIFVAPLAAPMEPLFPYLAVSFIGSIIGIAISQPKKALFKGFTKTVLLSGLVMFIVGAIGIVFEVINVLNVSGLDGVIDFYRFISFHRHWYPDVFNSTQPFHYGPHISSFAWLWQFLFTNGFSIIVCMIVIFLVEFRGRGSRFAKKTGYIRRYGIIAFSNYNNQWLNWIPSLFIPLLFGLESYSKMLWGGTILVIITTLAIYTIILYLWGMVNYRFSLEWFMRSIGYVLLPIRRDTASKKRKWWKKGDIDMDSNFYNSEWIDIVEENEAYHKENTDSKVSMLFSIFSLAIPIFFAFTLVTLPMTIKARKTEGINKRNTIALVFSIIGAVVTATFFVFVFITTPASLGIYL
ncbi:MAG: hypothetical protein ACTSU7_02330 [Candidatus Heimdallarchaeaceae archaeon]